MSLKLPPESRVSVDSLARELGVSQTPIREALSMLEANGLVSKAALRRLCHRPGMDRAQLDELFEFRLLIEPHAARKAAEDDDRRRHGPLASGEAAPSHDAFADLDTDFHRLIAQGAGNHLIANSWPGCTSMCISSAPVFGARSPRRRWTSMTRSSPPSGRAMTGPRRAPCAGIRAFLQAAAGLH